MRRRTSRTTGPQAPPGAPAQPRSLDAIRTAVEELLTEPLHGGGIEPTVAARQAVRGEQARVRPAPDGVDGHREQTCGAANGESTRHGSHAPILARLSGLA